MSGRWQVVVAGVVLLATVGLGAGRAAAEDVAAQEKAISTLLVAKLGEDAAAIRVTLVKGKAILTGEVKKRAVRDLAEEVVLTAAGVKKVDNQVSSASAGTIGKGKLREEAADADLETTVHKALKAEIGSHTKTIEIEACDGWVSLRGTAPDAARRDLALKTAAKVEGVAKVIDLIVVSAK
jgi:hyperosmotically inducible periplasmic protein